MKEIYKNYETEELVVMYQSTPNEDILREVLKRNARLLKLWAKDYGNIPCYNEEDLIEEGNIACWKAVGYYSPEKGVAFSTFLRAVVHRHYDRLYNEVTRKKRFTGAEPTSWEELEEIHKEKSVDFELLSNLEVKEFISSLEGKVQYIAIRLLEGYTKGDIARALGITPASTTYYIRRLKSLTCFLSSTFPKNYRQNSLFSPREFPCHWR